MSSDNFDTRRRILDACTQLLEEGAGTGVRMSDIAKRAGVSRQALYLHFAKRADLLVAATFHVDELKDAAQRLAPSRAATSGVERLNAYIEAWADYIPEIYPMARALIAMSETDEAAAVAWNQRMQDMKEGCEAAIVALRSDGTLANGYSVQEATDLLWALLQVETWRRLTEDCKWTQSKYKSHIAAAARHLFAKSG